MMTMLAQATGAVSFTDVLRASVDVGAVVVAVVAVLAYRRKKETRRILPDPLRTQAVFEPVSEEDCRRHRATIEEELKRISVQRQQDLIAQAGARKPLHEDIKAVRAEMGDMERRLTAQTEKQVGHVMAEVIKVLKAVARVEGRLAGRAQQEEEA